VNRGAILTVNLNIIIIINSEWLLVHYSAPEHEHGRWRYINAGLLLLLLYDRQTYLEIN
jgi:hypothetical protein